MSSTLSWPHTHCQSEMCGVRFQLCGVRCAVCGFNCAVCGVRFQLCGVRCAVSTVRCAVSMCGFLSRSQRRPEMSSFPGNSSCPSVSFQTILPTPRRRFHSRNGTRHSTRQLKWRQQNEGRSRDSTLFQNFPNYRPKYTRLINTDCYSITLWTSLSWYNVKQKL